MFCFSLSLMMVNEEPFGFELFNGQKKQFEDGIALGFGKL